MSNKQLLLLLDDYQVIERLSEEQRDEVVRAVKEMMVAVIETLTNERREKGRA